MIARIPKSRANINLTLVWSSGTNLRSAYFCSQQPAPTLFLFLTFYTFDHSTYWFAMLVNRRNRKHRSSVHFRKLLLYRGNEESWYSAFPQHTTAILVIPPPTHHFRMQDFGFACGCTSLVQYWPQLLTTLFWNKENEGLWNYFCLFDYYHKTWWFDFRPNLIWIILEYVLCK